MPDKGTRDDPPMATIDKIPPPHRGGSARGPWIVIIFMAAVIIGLLTLIVRPAKLDVYKTIGELAIADSALAA